MRKKLLFSVLVAAQLMAPAWIVYSSQAILTQGASYNFKTAPVDPYDAFRGRYVAVQVENAFVEPKVVGDYFHGQKVFVLLARDPAGFGSFADVAMKRPEHGDYLEVAVQQYQRVEYESFQTAEGQWQSKEKSVNKLYFQIPFNRFYMNEKKAPEAEKIYREVSSAETQSAHLKVRVLRGKALIEDLYIQDQPILNYLQERKE